MSKIATQLELAKAAQVCKTEVKKLAKILAYEVLGIPTDEWAKMTINYSKHLKKRASRRNKEVI